MSSAVVVFAGVGGSFCTLWVVEGGVGAEATLGEVWVEVGTRMLKRRNCGALGERQAYCSRSRRGGGVWWQGWGGKWDIQVGEQVERAFRQEQRTS